MYNAYGKALKWMKNQLRHEAETYDYGGDINCTKLAEDAAEELDLYENAECDIPDEVFDAAVDAAEWFADSNERNSAHDIDLYEYNEEEFALDEVMA